MIVNIRGERVLLGPLRRDLIPDYSRWHNDPEASRSGASHPRIGSVEAETRWLEGVVKSDDQARFTIYDRATERPIGIVGLTGIDDRARSCEFSILIGEAEFRGRGYGTEVTRLMLEYAFGTLGLHNVMLGCFEYNIAGLRAYEKTGFREFARRRQSHLMGGRLWDTVYMECLATEFTWRSSERAG